MQVDHPATAGLGVQQVHVLGDDRAHGTRPFEPGQGAVAGVGQGGVHVPPAEVVARPVVAAELGVTDELLVRHRIARRRIRTPVVGDPGVRRHAGAGDHTQAPATEYVDQSGEPALQGSAGSVPDDRIDQSGEILTGDEAGDVQRDVLGERRGTHRRRVGIVRGDDHVGQIPQRVTVGKRLGIGDVESRSADRVVPQRFHQGIGVNERAARDVDHPRGRLHLRELRGPDQMVRGVGGGSADHEVIRAGPHLAQAGGGERLDRARHRAAGAIDRDDVGADAREHRDQCPADAAGAHDGDRGAPQGADLREELLLAPGLRLEVLGQCPHPGQQQRQRVLGDGGGERARRRRPQHGGVGSDHLRGEPLLDTRGVQLHPADVLGQRVREPDRTRGPDQGVADSRGATRAPPRRIASSRSGSGAGPMAIAGTAASSAMGRTYAGTSISG